MIYYESIKITIDISGLTKIVLNIILWQQSLFNLIIYDESLVFLSKS